jgi:hypothetical protein
MTRRPLIGVGAVAVTVTILFAIVLGPLGGQRPAGADGPATSSAPTAQTGDAFGPAPTAPTNPGSGAGNGSDPGSSPAGPTPEPTPRPQPKHEVFGFLPYWTMVRGISDHLAKTKLTTLGLFSVTHTKSGKINTGQLGYQRITGPIGERIIAEAHHRKVQVQLAYTVFGKARNRTFFTSRDLQDKTIASLVALADRIGVDGINVDVERIDADLTAPYGDFVGRLREALRAKVPKARVSVAVTSGPVGGGMAAAAAKAGADRIFMMAYDYHYASSQPGAESPMDRRDGANPDLVWSLDLFESLGVPVERTILGLPLYGMRWRVEGPEIGAASLGDGAIWVPGENPKFLANPPQPPQLDPIEVVEVYAVPPTLKPSPGDTRAAAGWQAIYVDSAETLKPKMMLADERGLAGAGFWAIGYERGQPGYTDLIKTFAAGKLK